jgi:aryl-alcohol dehydrogenase-like predicted oxidoreductase
LVSKLCLGATVSGAWGNANRVDSIRIIDRALDAGINFIGVADAYSAGSASGQAPDPLPVGMRPLTPTAP